MQGYVADTLHNRANKSIMMRIIHSLLLTITLATLATGVYAQRTDLRYVVCGRGVDGPGGLASCSEGDSQKVHKDEKHEVRCCKEQESDGGGWSSKCGNFDKLIKGRSKIDGECHYLSFWDAFRLCNDADGRLCTKEEVENSCVKGTGCSYDKQQVWTCTEEGGDCTESAACCSGRCHPDHGYCTYDI